MNTSWELILGRYATNTLTEDEKRQLNEAALHDQTLFEALADEESLKALLAIPDERARILASLQQTAPSSATTSLAPTQPSWFRRTSSLAWVGGMAAMGLALIFGWQLDQDWGTVVNEEQQAAQSSPIKEHARKRQPVPAKRIGAVVSKKSHEKDAMLDGMKSEPGLAPVPEHDAAYSRTMMEKSEVKVGVMAKNTRAKEEDVMPESSALPLSRAQSDLSQVESEIPEALSHVMAKKEATQEEVSESSAMGKLGTAFQLSDSASDSSADRDEPVLQSLVKADVGKVAELNATNVTQIQKSIAAPESVPDRRALEESVPASALDMFYAEVGVGEEKEKDVSRDRESIKKAQGIRYSFIREKERAQEEFGDVSKVSDWRDVQLAIEPNQAGFLYVFAPIGRGKWQQLSGTTSMKPKDNPEAGNVEAYQVVEYQISAITNLLGKLVISSVTVLLSSSQLESVGKWLSSQVDTSAIQTEQTDDSVYVVRPEVRSDAPLQFVITLEE